MTRKEFIQMCSILGIGLPIQSAMKSCSKESVVSADEKVIIVGAGAGGLTAGYLLQQRGINFEILEASGQYGGRMRTTNNFVDFPISLGGEWLHVEKGVLSEIVNDSSVNIDIETTPYDFDNDYALFQGMRVSMEDIGFTIDQKFIGSSWFDFFEQYIVPSIKDKIRLNHVVSSIDYSGESVVISTSSGQFEANRLIFNAPLKMLQNGNISFTPDLPADKKEALRDLKVWDGFKAFIEFSEKFYPAAIAFDIVPANAGQRLYYDAAYGQRSSRNVLGLFSVGTGTEPYKSLSDNELRDYMLNELDEMFDGKASQTYIQHTSQNWNNEPYINGAYITDEEDWRKVRTMGQSLDNKIYFAGCAYTDGSDWSSVHAAGRSAIRAVSEMFG